VLSPPITHQQATTFQGHAGTIFSAVFSPDGGRVLTASDDKTARLCETGQDHRRARFRTASGDETARLWEADSGKKRLASRQILGSPRRSRLVNLIRWNLEFKESSKNSEHSVYDQFLNTAQKAGRGMKRLASSALVSRMRQSAV
jgi:hypothetical protein